MKPNDIRRVAEAAQDHIEAICAHWLPAGKRAGAEWETGDRHGSPGKSLKVHLSGSKAGTWADFSTDDRGGDAVALVAYIDAVSQSAAAEKLAAYLSLNIGQTAPATTPTKCTPGGAKPMCSSAQWQPLLPVPEDAPPAPVAHPKHGKPDRTYTYLGQGGELLGYVARWEASERRQKKEFGWLVFAQLGERREWRWQGFPSPRPLFGLDLLAAKSGSPVVLVEGEKAAEAGRMLLPGHVVLTWPGGGKAADKASFGPLQGRDVLLWADADEPGKAAMQTAARLLRKAGAKSIRWLSLPALAEARGDGELPNGFDAADLLAEGWDTERIADFLAAPGTILDSKAAPMATTQNATHAPDAIPAESRFIVSDEGLFYFEPGRDGAESRQVRIADKIEIPAMARDEESAGWSPVLVFRDMDRIQRTEIIPRRQFLGDGTDGPKQLADLGLFIEPGRLALDRLKAYVASARPERRARLVESTGWHGDAYLLPDGAIGDADETLIYRGSKRALGVFTPRGKLRDWQTHIAAQAEGNWRLLFALSVAFAGPLLKLCGGASCAFHWTGDSSLGKSGSLHAAGSVWGHPQGVVHSWRSTDNSLEYVAAQHNDGLLILDELKEVDPKQAGAIAYMLGNSKGKNRAHHAGGLRDAMTWRIAMLSSGELGLADHLASAGQKTHAGQTVRFIELMSDACEGHGMWNTVHSLRDGRAFTDHLKTAATKYYGTAGRAFLEALAQHQDQVPAALKAAEEHFFYHHVPSNAGGQVQRVAASFALVATAGELAAEWRVCPWDRHAVLSAAGMLFKEWLNARPTAGNLEEAQILAHVRQVMERNWQARFIDWHRVTEVNADLSRMAAVPDALGFRKDAAKRDRAPDEDATYKRTTHEANYHFYVTRSRFNEEFANKAGFKPRRVAAVLRAKGILQSDEDGATWRETLPNGDPRSYCIIGAKLWEVAASA